MLIMLACYLSWFVKNQEHLLKLYFVMSQFSVKLRALLFSTLDASYSYVVFAGFVVCCKEIIQTKGTCRKCIDAINIQ